MRLFAQFGLRSSLWARPFSPSDRVSYAPYRQIKCFFLAAVLLLIFWTATFLSAPPKAMAQSVDSGANREVVANLAAGRVIIAVVKDAILVGTVENPLEVHTIPPIPVQLASERFGVFLGPVDWWSPPSKREIGQLDQELPRLHTYAVATPPHLGQSKGGDQPAEIEITGESLHQRLNQLAETLHGSLNLPPKEPFAQLIVADYFAGYGPEIWRLSYSVEQEEQEGDFWTTRVDGPTYLQFWPPEKGQPRTLVEFDYPQQGSPPSLLSLLQHQDPRVERIMQSDPTMNEVAQHFLDGTSDKVRAADATQFLRAVLDTVAPQHARETFGVLRPDTGFSWVLPPPPEAPIHHENRPPGAPTLQTH